MIKVLKPEVFFLILKAFGNVWHECLIFTLKQSKILGNLLSVSIDFEKGRKQTVVLNG